jgi:predicted peptidase
MSSLGILSFFISEKESPKVDYESHTISYPESIYTVKTEDTTTEGNEGIPQKTATFREEIVRINGELAYIAYPLEFTEENPPTIVVYNHGQFEKIDETYVEKNRLSSNLRTYAEELTKDNKYILAASNQHGDSWGDSASIKDNQDMINYITERNVTEDRVNLIGFSMGGYSALNFSKKYPDQVASIALLSPGTGYFDWTTNEYRQLIGIPIKIWHGEDDVNILISHSIDFVETAKEKGLSIGLVSIPEYTHYDTDENLQSEVTNFFIETNRNAYQ